jgi:ATPase subunit of ABC transporter with duplicated ATPase domains
MLVNAAITEKHMGSKLLFKDLNFTLQERARVGLIGRNGIGKSTLFGMLTGEDTEYVGTVERKKGIRVVVTAQEHFDVDESSAVAYVLDNIPDYYQLKEVLATYPDTMGSDMAKIQTYTEALEIFTENNYYTVEDEIVEALKRFNIDIDAAFRPLKTLSGGQKRFVELVKVTFARPDIILLDEPTNHLDYHGKELFLDWLRGLKTACCIISHDRDVLKEMELIIEIRDYQAFSYPGNYEDYIRQNGTNTISEVNEYESALKRLAILKGQIRVAAARKGQVSNSAPRILEDRLQREYDALEANLEKPSFWIDRETTATLGKDNANSYQKYKARTIRISGVTEDKHKRQLLEVEKLAIGYDHSLFSPVSFRLSHGDRLVFRGRNGAGKSTLIKALLASINNKPTDIKTFEGTVKPSNQLRVGVYEQEIDSKYLPMTLGKAVETVYQDAGLPMHDQLLSKILAGYLFDPTRDKELTVKHLSGGQKARFQLIRMLCTNPNLLILDEPTNHLDLPSIEELEDAIRQYHGAVIYVSHDSYFIEHIGGRILQVGKA